MKKYLALLIIFDSFLLGLTIDVPVSMTDYEIETRLGYDRITVKSAITAGNPGAPEIPVLTYSYCLPVNERARSVNIVEEVWQDIAGTYYLFPEQAATSIEEPESFTLPDQTRYDSDEWYPCQTIIDQSSGNLRGYRIVQFSLALFRYQGSGRKLQRLTKAKVIIETKPGGGIAPLRQSAWSKAFFESFVASLTQNKPFAPSSRIAANPEDAAPAELPSLLGPPVDLLIITTEDQVPAYEEFQHFKKLFGFNAVLKTMTWVKQHYTGIDDAEQLRNFIADAVEKWGVSQVLLGGDVPAIPTRLVWFAPLMGQYPMHIATDLYFSDLDNEAAGQGTSWNFDGDDKFGEVEDSIDFYPDVFVGRLPSTSGHQVQNYLYKLKHYLSPSTGAVKSWTDKALFITSDFYTSNDAYNMATRLRAHVPPEFHSLIINEQPLAAVKNEIYKPYGMINLLGHGDINQARIRTNPRENMTTFFCDSLTNIAYPLMVIITCYCGPYEVDCLGEHWVVGDTIGGGVGFIGPSSSSSAYDHEAFTIALFDYLYSDTIGHPLLGAAQAFQKIPYIASSQWYNWKRVFQFSINLLGDPAIPVWDTLASRFALVAVAPETLQVGADTIALLVNPATTFAAVLYKENEVFITDSGSSGFIQIPVKTISSGYLKYSIIKHGYVTHIDSVFVKPAGPWAVYDTSRIVDSLHNDNGVINPGEDIFLYVTLKNTGGAIAQNLWARIACSDTFITMISDSTSYPNILPGQTGENIIPYHFLTAFSLPDEHSLDLCMTINYTSTAGADTFQVECSSPRIRLFKQSSSYCADTIAIMPTLENAGSAPSDSLIAQISAVSADTLVMLDSLVIFPPMQPGAIVSPYPDSFKVLLAYPGVPEYFMHLKYHGEQIMNQKITLAVPPPPDSVWAWGKTHSIVVANTPDPAVFGYRIYRSTQEIGPYTFIRNPLNSTAMFEDFTVQDRTKYYYFVTAVDSSMNESGSSETTWIWTNPQLKPGWPTTVYGYQFSSPNFGNIDPAYAGLEVVATAKDGGLYAWHCDGTPVTGDGRLYQATGEIWSSPAIGNIDNSGTLEIVFAVRTWSYGNLYAVDNQGEILPGWPKVLSSIISSPVLADIDNDGDLEIFVCTESGELYAFHHNGQGVYNASGLLRQLYGWIGGTPAIADINNDNFLEIVVPGGEDCDSLFVFTHDGMNLPPFPIPVMRRMVYSPVLGNILGDDKLEICVYSDSSDYVHFIDASGSILWQKQINYLGDVEAGPIFADLTGDGHPEVICGNSTTLLALDSLGNELPGFPPFEDHDYNLPIVADLDGNDLMDITYGSTEWSLFANTSTADPVPGFPISMGSYVESSPAAYDIDNDSCLELMSGANGFKFFVFDLEGINFEWPKFRYDQYNTGAYQSGHLQVETPNTWPDHDGAQISLSVFPTPFCGSLRITLVFPSEEGAQPAEPVLSIYDVTGRLVKHYSLLTNHSFNQIIWSCTDDAGREVPAGIYFIRLQAGLKTLTEKTILLK
ncbi:MAG TPA: C25 family cysteine peptidase [bacterium]